MKIEIINKLFPLKFKVRIVHFSKQYYYIEYCHYKIFKNWYYLGYWFDTGPSSQIYNWSEKLFTYKEAEEIAKNIKNIEDVNNYHAPEIAKKKAFRKARKKWKKENIPYKNKSII